MLIMSRQIQQAAATNSRIVFMGDFNLDASRVNDPTYRRAHLLNELRESTNVAGFEYLATSHTWTSHGAFDGVHRQSTIDHVYVAGIGADVKVLDDRSTDHFALLTCVSFGGIPRKTEKLMRRNLKKLTKQDLEAALERACDWAEAFKYKDPEDVLEFLTAGITAALNEVAPLKEIKVKTGRDLYLGSDTLNVIKMRDLAKGAEYRRLRNRACALVARDKKRSNASKLAEAGNDSRLLWELANAAIGKCRTTLPNNLLNVDGSPTESSADAANLVNEFYVAKVDKLRERNIGHDPIKSDWPKETGDFGFSFTNAGRITKVVKGLKSTNAAGVDDIPIGVYKMGIDVLAAPVAHMVNRSLAVGRVPGQLKVGIIHPIFKGGGKNRLDPASYRPVSILPAVSKVLEVIVKKDVEAFINKIRALPDGQHGFRAGRSCTSALATAHANWIEARGRGSGGGSSRVGVLSFDLSAAFDTLDPAVLLPKLNSLGIRGMPLRWFTSYLTGGKQIVDWLGTRSRALDVKFGVRQGSILGPLLFLIHVADMPNVVGNMTAGYADDSHSAEVASTTAELLPRLNAKAARFVSWAKGSGLAVNGSKTQLLLSNGCKYNNGDDVFTMVDGMRVNPTDNMELLGVKMDRRFTFAPHAADVAAAARSRASLIARLGHHLPTGRYLTSLSTGLVLGKLLHALPAVAGPRLNMESVISGSERKIQVSLNDVCRTITGARRSDHVRLHTLQNAAKIPTYNHMSTSAVAMEAWKCFWSRDGAKGNRNELGIRIFGNLDLDSDNGSSPIEYASVARCSRSETAGKVKIALRGASTFVTHAGKIWNASAALRAAKSLTDAKQAARAIAMSTPV
jgi:hypothetical protein